MKRDNRPLLKTENPEATMQRLMDVRYPVYRHADITVQSREVPHETIVTGLGERHVEIALFRLERQFGVKAALSAPRIAYLSGRSQETDAHLLEAFKEGLKTLGYVDGQNVSFDVRWANGRYHDVPAMAQQVVAADQVDEAVFVSVDEDRDRAESDDRQRCRKGRKRCS